MSEHHAADNDELSKLRHERIHGGMVWCIDVCGMDRADQPCVGGGGGARSRGAAGRLPRPQHKVVGDKEAAGEADMTRKVGPQKP